MAAPSGIVTPEAVVLEFETAALASRLMAAAVDVTVQGLLLIGTVLAVTGANAAGLQEGGLAIALGYVGVFAVLFGYPAAMETLWRGRTLGKAVFGLRVVTVEGAPVRFRHAAIRSILGIVDKYLFTGIVGVGCILFTRRNQRIGDLVAGTIVLRGRSGRKAPAAVAFPAPYGLEGYVASLDVAGLGHRDYGAVRSFLLRATSLAPASRAALAEQLAAPLRQRLRTVPPPGVGAEVFLACVAAAFQRNDGRARPTHPVPAFTSVWSDE
jgi:uncharacterized RDD family membrane protein YckC